MQSIQEMLWYGQIGNHIGYIYPKIRKSLEPKKMTQNNVNEMADDIIGDLQEIINNFQITENGHRRQKEIQFENMLVTALKNVNLGGK